MRKLIAASLLALSLAACQTPGGSPTVGTVVGALPEQVQTVAVQVCGFLPAAATVAGLIAAFGGPTVPGIASRIANEICSAVTKKSAVRGRVPTVKGVAVRGRFVS